MKMDRKDQIFMNYVLDHTGKPYAKLFEDISAIP